MRPDVRDAVARMRRWAGAHGECDTQGITDGEWLALARAALDAGPDRWRCDACDYLTPDSQTPDQCPACDVGPYGSWTGADAPSPRCSA